MADVTLPGPDEMVLDARDVLKLLGVSPATMNADYRSLPNFQN